MRLHHYLMLLATPLLGTTAFCVPSWAQASTPPICLCSLQPATSVKLSWMELTPETIAVIPETYTINSDYLTLPQSSKISEGPPSEDKGTPGNRGGCRYNQCSAYQNQVPHPQNSPAKQTITVKQTIPLKRNLQVLEPDLD